MSVPQTFALIPAAGQSRRMGRPKLLLPLGNRTVLERLIDAVKQAAVGDVLVVVSPEPRELAADAEHAGASVLRLPEETPAMRATVERGLAWLEATFAPQPADSWLLCPADHPTLSPRIVTDLLEARATHPERSIFVPTFEDRRGHPVLIGWHHVAAIRRRDAQEGLNVYLREQVEQTFLLPMSTEDVLMDLDTPADYARLLQRDW